MCMICYSTVTITALITPTASITAIPTPTPSITVISTPTDSITASPTPYILTEKNPKLENINNDYKKYKKEDIIYTNKTCNKKLLYKTKDNLICMKNKKLYQWVKIKNPSEKTNTNKQTTPTPDSTTTPTPTQTPESTTTPTPDSTTNPNPDSTTTPTPTPTPTPLGVSEVIKSFIEFSKNEIEPQHIVYNKSPNADKKTSEEIEKNVNNIIKLFAPYDQHIDPFQVFITSKSEVEWTVNEWAKHNLTDPATVMRFINLENKEFSPFTIFPSKINVTWNESNWEGTFNYNPPPGDFTSTLDEGTLLKWHYYDGDGSIGHKKAEEGARKNTISHHIIHSIQSRITGGRSTSLGCWGTEGGAEFYGALSASTFNDLDYLEYRNNQITQFTRTYPVAPIPGTDLRKYNEIQWLETIKNIECNPDSDSITYNLQYSVGILLYEKLAIDFGHKKIMEWWHEMREESRCVLLSHEKKSCWKEPFKRIFKIDVDTWYKNNAIPYLITEYTSWTAPKWWVEVGGVDFRDKY